ncbi:IS1634 family transposase [Aquibacillus sp. 3ASR75-11]|uniref:IS1634 family transposase n=1 Tax=Terrihalobacillus insolitus TaxID=2950438 RepID=A0A9X3WPX8_9BACI|nr:IS1634 family transposase [Terrihalobacillus insolitus]MDC3423650.1 IS1634 family transposase [Terrihalobacillus insolitus]
MGIIYQRNNKTGITYAYRNESYWDKEKKQSRAKRTLIGKVDPDTGNIVPTRAYRKNQDAQDTPLKPGPVPITKLQRSFYGATYLFDQIGDATGITADLKACFPDIYKQILSLAYYLILEENNALSRFPHWQKLHIHPFGQDIPSQRSSDLFQSIDEEARMKFFKKQGKRRIETEYWAFDTTSISSYSDTLKQVKKGRNKEHDILPQLNLALLFGEDSGLPFYYRKLPGNLTDMKTVKQLMKEFDVMGYKKVNVIFDRGFYSRENINTLYKHHQKFIIGVKLGLKYVKEVLEEERENLKLWANFKTQFGTYGICRKITWDYEQERPYKGDILKEKRRAYLLLFYNPEKAAKDQADMNEYLTSLHHDLLENTLKEYRMKDYQKYFEVTETPKRGRKIKPREEAMREAAQNYGYFALLSNEIKEPFQSLSLYRSKDIVEKGFGNLKERLNFRRLQVSSELSLNGKLFVEFIALIYLSYIKKKMQDAALFEKWTIQGLLDELDIIELLETPEHGRVLGEMTKKQKELYAALGVKPPSL